MSKVNKTFGFLIIILSIINCVVSSLNLHTVIILLAVTISHILNYVKYD